MIISYRITIRFLIRWHMVTNVFFLQLLVFRVSPISIVIGAILDSHICFPHLMYSFLIVAFSGIDLALLAHASCLDLILFMNLVALSVVLLAFASTFCNEVHLFPKRGLLKSIDGFLLLSLY